MSKSCHPIHGKAAQHPLYSTYNGMHDRCKRNSRYVSKGIRVCSRWSKGQPLAQGFWNFVADVGEKPEGMTLDRIDNDGNYCPENCRWATPRQQTKNADLAKGERHGSAKLTAELVGTAKKLLLKGVSTKEVGEIVGASRQSIADIKAGRTWSHLKD